MKAIYNYKTNGNRIETHFDDVVRIRQKAGTISVIDRNDNKFHIPEWELREKDGKIILMADDADENDYLPF